MRKLSILFEAGPMVDQKKTGVGFYVNHLIGGLQTYYGDRLDFQGYYFNFLHRNPSKTPKDSLVSYQEIRYMPGKILSVCRRLHFQPYLELFVRMRPDIVLFTNYVALPIIGRRKVALIVYDTSFLDVPEYTQEVNLAYLKRFCPPSIERADLIITISDFTKDRLEHYFPHLKAPIIVTPIPPLKAPVKGLELTPKLTQSGVQSRQYILYIGTIEPRKNLKALLSAYSLLAPELKKRFSLVLAGGRGWKDEAIREQIQIQQQKGENIIVTGYVSETEKQALYSHAACFVLPSHYEGFGMPILEAMQHDTPTIVSDIPVFHEVAGNAAVYFNKDHPEDITQAISNVLQNNALQQQLILKGRKQLQIFSWEDNARHVYDAIRSITPGLI